MFTKCLIYPIDLLIFLSGKETKKKNTKHISLLIYLIKSQKTLDKLANIEIEAFPWETKKAIGWRSIYRHAFELYIIATNLVYGEKTLSEKK